MDKGTPRQHFVMALFASTIIQALALNNEEVVVE